MKNLKFILSVALMVAFVGSFAFGAESYDIMTASAALSVVSFPDWLQEAHKMTETELKAQDNVEALAEKYNEYNSVWKSAVKDALENKVEANDIAKLRNDFTDSIAKQAGEMNVILEKHGVALTQILKGNTSKGAVSFTESLKEALTENLDQLKNIKETKSRDSVTLKAVGPITRPLSVTGQVPVEDRMEGMDQLARRQVRLLDVMSRRGTTSNLVSWVSQVAGEGTAGQTAEGSAKNQVDWDIVVNSESLKTTTAFIKVSTQMLDDVSWMQSEIESDLMLRVALALETQVLTGDDSGENHNGLETVAEGFTGAAYAGQVPEANILDVAVISLGQIAENEHTAVRPYIFMHPSQITGLKLSKVGGTDGRYNMRLVDAAGQLSLDGVPIISTTLIAANELFVGAMENAILVMNDSISIDVGLDADDFSKNLRTVLCEVRALTIVKNNKRNSMIYCPSVSVAIAALETP